MKTIPKTWQEAEKLGFEFDGEEWKESRDRQARRGTAFMVLCGPSKTVNGLTIEGNALAYLDVPVTAQVTLGRPHRPRISKGAANSGQVTA